VIALPLVALIAAAPVALDVEHVGLSTLEAGAIEERLIAEIGGDVVRANGLVACEEDARCAARIIDAAQARAGIAVRVVKVLQVVRIDAVLFQGGEVAAQSSRNLALAEAARGRLLEEKLLSLIAPSPTEERQPNEQPPGNAQRETGSLQPVAIAAALVGGITALAAGALAVNEAFVANSASSLGAEKERARVAGPTFVAVAVAGLALGASAAAFALAGQ
jgi:hypothetical protein